ncbi:MAG: hypothetical protein JO033_11985 [Acidobacteriaceae bacterium]|nr:hypothetical protein [Acidobacteriaceae bacterium]MBV9503037.1 hypothetical protein [Acidobacteriaceae bacterium]
MYPRKMRVQAARSAFVGGLAFFLCFLLGVWVVSPAEITGPLAVSSNPNYFKDASGATIILVGSQTWNTFQD